MPRLPGISDVRRVSTDGLRLPALQAPAVDPTGAALQDFGQSLDTFGKSLDAFAKKQKLLKAAEDEATAHSVDADLTQYRSGLIETPPPENSDDTGPDEPDPVQRRLSAYDQFATDRIEGIGEGPLRDRVNSIVAKGRETLELRSRIKDHNQRLGSFSGVLESTLATVRATAAQQPDLLEVSRDRGLSAVRETAKVMGWTDDVLREKEQQFDRELLAGVIQGRIGRGEAPQVLELLRDAEMTALFDEATIADLTQEAEARHGSELAAILSGLDIHGDAILRTGRGVEGVAERAETTLSPEDHAVFLAAQRRFQAVRDHSVRFDRKSRAELEAALETSFPGEWASEEDQETFQALRDKTSVMLLERQRDPAGVAGRDPVVESLHRTGRGAEARALSLEIQKQMEVPEEQRRLLSNAEAQSKVAALNRMPAALRVQELAALKETDEKQYLRMVAELSRHGLDRPAQALAVVVGNEALTDLMASAQTQGRAKLRENATDEERAAVTGAVRSALERIASEEGIDARGFGFAVEDLAFQFFNLTGDAETAAEDAAALFTRQLVTFAPKGIRDALGDATKFGKASIHLASAIGENRGDEEGDTIPGGAGADELPQGADQTQSEEEQDGRLEPPISGATGRVEVPFSGTPGTEVDGPPQDLPDTLQKLGDDFNKHARGVLGPAYEPAVALLKVVEFFSPVSDLKDMRDGIQEMVEGIQNSDVDLVIQGRNKFIAGRYSRSYPELLGRPQKLSMT